LVITPIINNLSGYPAAKRFNQFGAGVREDFGVNDAHLIDPENFFEVNLRHVLHTLT
jgi:hypothetical protein